jgi:hypothetical protein
MDAKKPHISTCVAVVTLPESDLATCAVPVIEFIVHSTSAPDTDFVGAPTKLCSVVGNVPDSALAAA